MILVILGAGASYDSVAAAPAGAPVAALYPRLPLADQLFALREPFRIASEAYPEIQAILPNLPPRASGSVEAALDEMAGEQERHPERGRQLLAIRFYITQIIRESQKRWCEEHHGELNHAALFDLLDLYRGSEEVGIVTFNYDTLVERCLVRRFGSTPDFGALTDGRAGYRLFKLHGSVSWNRIVTTPDVESARTMRGLLDKHSEIQLTEKFRMVEAARAEAVYLDGQYMIPAIAVPLAKKSGFECPAGHVETLKGLLPDVSRVIVVGWRAGEEHFLSLLKDRVKATAPLLILNGGEEGGRETHERLRAAGLGGPTPSFGFGFTTGLGGGYVKKWLSGEIQ